MSDVACTRCGCTEQHACDGGCCWMPPPLERVCSACADLDELKDAIARLEVAFADGGHTCDVVNLRSAILYLRAELANRC